MSQARVHYVKSAQQRYERVAKVDDEGKQVVTAVTSRRTGEQRLSRSGRPIQKRIRVADKAKPLPQPKCGKCGDTIEVGQPYRHFTVGFRGWKQYRCMKSTCTPTRSELESSEHVGNIYAALDDAVANLQAWEGDDSGDAQQALEEEAGNVADAIQEAIDAYREADEAFGGQGATEHAERADNLESAIYEFQSPQLSVDDPEGCGDAFRGEDTDPDEPDHDEPTEGCAECDTRLDEWRQETRDAMVSALEDIDLGV